MDMMAPLVHEFTYQAMANDVLPIVNGTRYTFVLSYTSASTANSVFYYRYKFQSSIGAYEDKTASLTDADSVWTEVRHMHMREAIDKLMEDFNKFLTENAVFSGWVSSVVCASLLSIKSLLEAVQQT